MTDQLSQSNSQQLIDDFEAFLLAEQMQANQTQVSQFIPTFNRQPLPWSDETERRFLATEQRLGPMPNRNATWTAAATKKLLELRLDPAHELVQSFAGSHKQTVGQAWKSLANKLAMNNLTYYAEGLPEPQNYTSTQCYNHYKALSSKYKAQLAARGPNNSGGAGPKYDIKQQFEHFEYMHYWLHCKNKYVPQHVKTSNQAKTTQHCQASISSSTSTSTSTSKTSTKTTTSNPSSQEVEEITHFSDDDSASIVTPSRPNKRRRSQLSLTSSKDPSTFSTPNALQRMEKMQQTLMEQNERMTSAIENLAAAFMSQPKAAK
jgi:hypothetical protein